MVCFLGQLKYHFWWRDHDKPPSSGTCHLCSLNSPQPVSFAGWKLGWTGSDVPESKCLVRVHFNPDLDLIYVFTACNNTVRQYKTVHLGTVNIMFIQAHSFTKGVILLVFPPTGKPFSQGTSHPSAHFHAWWYDDSCCGNGCPTAAPAAAATGNSSHILK